MQLELKTIVSFESFSFRQKFTLSIFDRNLLIFYFWNSIYFLSFLMILTTMGTFYSIKAMI